MNKINRFWSLQLMEHVGLLNEGLTHGDGPQNRLENRNISNTNNHNSILWNFTLYYSVSFGTNIDEVLIKIIFLSFQGTSSHSPKVDRYVSVAIC